MLIFLRTLVKNNICQEGDAITADELAKKIGTILITQLSLE